MQTPGDPRETYVPRMAWHPKGEELMLQWLPRAQNRLVVYGADVKTGAVRVVHEEQDEAYVDVRDDFAWVYGGEKFFWTSDTAFHQGDGKRFRQCGTIEWDTRGKQVLLTSMALTKGFDVIDVAHVDLAKEQLYVSAAPGAATQRELFAVSLGSGTAKALTPQGLPKRYAAQAANGAAAGWHEYQLSPDGALAIHTWSAFDQPPIVDLVRLPSHERVRVLIDNEALRAAVGRLAAGTQRVLPGRSRRRGHARRLGDVSRGLRCGEVVAGGCSTSTASRGRRRSRTPGSCRTTCFHRWLTQLGYVVMSVDARGTPAPKGRDWRKALYQNIGITSSADWNAAVTALRGKHAWMDPQRQAIWGWSGGGAMTLNMLFRYPDLFAAGMSVAPVTDITLYDTIYQERYCGDPRQVPEVYRQCSPINFAKNLKGQLLLVHGTGDDNVHFQNSERLFDDWSRTASCSSTWPTRIARMRSANVPAPARTSTGRWPTSCSAGVPAGPRPRTADGGR